MDLIQRFLGTNIIISNYRIIEKSKSLVADSVVLQTIVIKIFLH